MARASACLFAAAVILMAGCVEPNPEHPEEGEHVLAPPDGVGRLSLDVNGFLIDYSAPGAPEANELQWPMTDAQEWEEGVFTLPAVLTDDGHALANFTLAFRIDGPHPLQLAFNETLALTNTFNVTYAENASWLNRDADLERVVSVSDESWVDVVTWDRHKARLTGSFHLDFEAASEDGTVTERIVLDGQFPIPRRH